MNEISNYSIRVSNVSKRYSLYQKPSDRLREVLWLGMKQFHTDFMALKNVSFTLGVGQTIGIIGKNGSGKSTLLKIITGVLSPSEGTVEVNGKVAALLELGAGFNPELSGYENIFLSGLLMGFSREQIEENLEKIIAFADIGPFISQPVKTYSSGMFVRLAFAVNIHVKPDILIVDEALSVGDAAFQAKCLKAIDDIKRDGATILLVTHDIGTLRAIADVAVYLDQGSCIHFGPAAFVAEEYNRRSRQEMSSSGVLKENGVNLPNLFAADVPRYGTGRARVVKVQLLNDEFESSTKFEFDSVYYLDVHFQSATSGMKVSLNYYINDSKLQPILGASLRVLGEDLVECEEGRAYRVRFGSRLPLQAGFYSIQVQLTTPIVKDETAEFLDVIDMACTFEVMRRKDAQIWSKAFVPTACVVEKLGND